MLLSCCADQTTGESKIFWKVPCLLLSDKQTLCQNGATFMIRLTYISQAINGLDPATVQQIGEISARNNQRSQITGVLLFLDGVFFQILEGEAAIVKQLYEKILCDERHDNIICLKTEPHITERLFPEWAMKVVDLGQYQETYIRPLKSLLHTLGESHQLIDKYTQPAISKMIMQGMNPLTVQPKLVKKIVMFSDIMAFSTFTEILPEIQIVNLVNHYCTRCTEIISAHGGEVIKFIGDCVMASFDGEQADMAIQAATEILRQFKQLRQNTAPNDPLSLLYTGIGMAYGNVIQGNMGSALKMDYTLLGDTVNVAARLETLTRQLPYALAICADLKQQCRNDWTFVALGKYQVKGKQNSVEVYSVDHQDTPQVIHHDVPLSALIYQRLKT